jgi:hypothetical protein
MWQLAERACTVEASFSGLFEMNKRDMYLHRAKLFSHFFRDEQT